ncbi:DUF6233 domain-containing protein [Streptomyces paradoxus]|uniref:DUF6233 domain-containing protein n=1 Tax=Streptomyces paradoxus TaxID=66375 RepID=UPI00381B478A
MPTRPGSRRRLLRRGQPPPPIDRAEVRRVLASGLPACRHCHPDTDLRIID